MIGIIDYNAGNITSVQRSLTHLGMDFILSKSPADLDKCDKLIFPGVGDATFAMKQLKETGFDSFIKEKTAANLPLLGICLGSQIIFEFSEEGNSSCLGLIPGKISQINVNKNGYVSVIVSGTNSKSRKNKTFLFN